MAYLSKNQPCYAVLVCGVTNGVIDETRIAGVTLHPQDAVGYAENEMQYLEDKGYECVQEIDEMYKGVYWSLWAGNNQYNGSPRSVEVKIQKSALMQ